MLTAVGLVGAIVVAIALWAWLGRSLGRGHLGVERSTNHYLWEQEIRRHPYSPRLVAVCRDIRNYDRKDCVVFYLIIGCPLGLTVALLVWLTRYSDSTIADRMHSSNRVDGKNDPRAYQHHSNY